MLRMRTIIGLAMALVWFAGSATAGVYMKQKVTQPEVKDKKDIEQMTEMWVTPTRIRYNAGDQSSIFDAEKNLMITIDHAKKEYMEIPLDFSVASASTDQQSMNNLPGFMKNMMKMEVTVQPTGEKKEIGQWSCEKYLQTVKMPMVSMESEIWATQDIHVNMDVYKKFNAALMASQPGFFKIFGDMMKESEKIKGIPVFQKTMSKAMGKTAETTTELIEVKETEVPANLFTVPAGYKKEKFKED